MEGGVEYQANPEGARSRARAVAALTASGAAAVAAGLVLSPAASTLPPWALALGAAASVLLLMSTALYGTASLKSAGRDYPDIDAHQTAAKQLIKNIRAWTLSGSAVALAGLICLAGSLLVVIVSASISVPVQVSLKPNALESVRSICPHADERITATVRGGPRLAAAGSFVSLRLDGSACSEQDSGPLDVVLPVAEIQQIATLP